ncbi:outer membrane protein assembly factor BamA [Mangrovibacterium lignilyticum]|uniref:outer membrane protein assembly factor BamA n=1 Tax=Mangrovibacterium lignilyticum TaxID=2668052 RepID=UPI0013D772D4|nr:outer membrane protein assembly factor BamA [Mangrovibacterium lignilyticum]
MKTSALITISFFCLLFQFPDQLAAQENYEIRKIKFEGNDTIPESMLSDAMVLHSVSFMEKLFMQKEASLYHDQLIETDIERLTRFYHREGFLDAKIDLLDTEINDKKEQINLIFKVEEGQPFRVDSVSFTTTNNPPEINANSVFRTVQKDIVLHKGARFVDDELVNDLNRIQNEFKNIGYAYAQTSYTLTPKVATHLVSIQFVLDAGPKCYFGETTLDGNIHVKEKFIRKQLTYEKGGVYNSSQLDETRKNMYKLQLFSVLSVRPQTTKEKTTPIPIKLYIDEAPRFTSKYGVGYGTEDKFRAFTELNYKGFPSGANRFSLLLKHSALTPYQVNLSYIHPHFFDPKISLTINPFISRNKEPGYDIRDIGFNVKISDQFTDNFSGHINYYLEKVKNYEAEIDPVTMEETDIPYSKSGVLFSVLFDDSEPKFSPLKGLNIMLAYKLNGYAFGGDYNYSRIWTDIRHYQELGSLVLASRLMVGGIHSGDQDKYLPAEDRFYAGGSNSVRGWQRSELGPIRDNGKPLGGSSVIQGSAELRIPLVWKLSVVSFLDFGNVWVDEFHYKLNDLAYSGGGGLRFDTPIGPIRFDVGVPLWNEKRSAEFFISVGQAF